VTGATVMLCVRLSLLKANRIPRAVIGVCAPGDQRAVSQVWS